MIHFLNSFPKKQFTTGTLHYLNPVSLDRTSSSTLYSTSNTQSPTHLTYLLYLISSPWHLRQLLLYLFPSSYKNIYNSCSSQKFIADKRESGGTVRPTEPTVLPGRMSYQNSAIIIYSVGTRLQEQNCSHFSVEVTSRVRPRRIQMLAQLAKRQGHPTMTT